MWQASTQNSLTKNTSDSWMHSTNRPKKSVLTRPRGPFHSPATTSIIVLLVLAVLAPDLLTTVLLAVLVGAVLADASIYVLTRRPRSQTDRDDSQTTTEHDDSRTATERDESQATTERDESQAITE